MILVVYGAKIRITDSLFHVSNLPVKFWQSWYSECTHQIGHNFLQ